MGKLENKSAQRNKSKNIIAIAAFEANLKRRLRAHLKSLGYTKAPDGGLQPPGSSKDAVRALHLAQRNDRLRASRAFIDASLPELLVHFASGDDIVPAQVSPRLERIEAGSWQGDLFRLASLTWAVPVSNGFGRRLRYLVWDDQNDKLIGLLAIGDPVFNLSARDNLIEWSTKQRASRLVNVMDAYVLGAVPPYNMLLGGKLIASLIRTRDLYTEFGKAYGDTKGIISKKKKKARLLVVTTSSALGRSSIYNRVKLGETLYMKSIGYTGGWGHFHIPDVLFSDLRRYLKLKRHKYASGHRFGQGPNWKLRATRAALGMLGFRDDLLRHGIQREVFISELATNATKILKSGKGRANLRSLLTAKEVGQLAVKRWLAPRAERRPEYRLWRVENIKDLLTEQKSTTRIEQKPQLKLVQGGNPHD